MLKSISAVLASTLTLGITLPADASNYIVKDNFPSKCESFRGNSNVAFDYCRSFRVVQSQGGYNFIFGFGDVAVGYRTSDGYQRTTRLNGRTYYVYDINTRALASNSGTEASPSDGACLVSQNWDDIACGKRELMYRYIK
jgi:hypothetical protein